MPVAAAGDFDSGFLMFDFERIVRARARVLSWLLALGTLGIASEAAACPNCTVGEHVGRPFWEGGAALAFAVSLTALVVGLGLSLRSGSSASRRREGLASSKLRRVT